jgi:hypothetical protein
MFGVGVGVRVGGQRFGSGVAPYVGLLDTYPNAAAAYSLRLLKSDYTGNAIRVRRSSDNAEQNIGFVNGNLDTSTLTSFCSGTNGFVTTWYDQSGNARNATQTTAANQPQIVSSGSVLTTNGKPSASFDGINDSLFTSGTPFSATENTLIAVSKTNVIIAQYQRLFCIGLYNDGRYLGSNNSTDDMLAIFNNSTLTCFGGVAITQNVSIMYNTGTNGVLWQNGSQVNTVTATNSSYGSENLYIGGDKAQTIGEFWAGIGQEFIFYPSSQSSNVAGIGTNINSYYGIY